MSMIDAQRFLTKCRTEPDLCDRIWDLPSPASFFNWASSEGFHFTNEDVMHAFDEMRIHAADEFEAEAIDELSAWYQVVAMDEEDDLDFDESDSFELFDEREEVLSVKSARC